jgi:hypothetical protein
MKNLLLSTTLVLILFSCIQPPEINGLGGYMDEEDLFLELTDSSKIITEDLDKSINEDSVQVIKFTNELIDLLSIGDWTGFSEHFHPTEGCTFVPYTFMTEDEQVFTAKSFQESIKNNTKHNWGEQDGSGNPIISTIKDYSSNYIYSANFKDSLVEIHYNQDFAFSNTQNNIYEYFPFSDAIEYYHPGSKGYEDMDWRSVIFRCSLIDGKYYLIAVVHNEWTI